MQELIGKTIVGIRVSDDQGILTFDHPNGETTSYEAEGDCCSETWFADITGVEALLGDVVLTAESVELDEVVDGRTRQEHDHFYGVKLTTSKGYADIVYRNSSNGYYGGDIHLFTRPLPESMVAITADWQA